MLTASDHAAALARFRRGCTERRTEAKRRQNEGARLVAYALARGDPEEADRLRWLYWPERMRARQLAREAGLPPPK